MNHLSNNKLKSWLLPLIVALGIFLFARPTFAQIVEDQLNLADFLTANNVVVGEETVDGHRQIYYFFNGEKVFITSGNYNSRMPIASGEYIAYVTEINGSGQIFLYHILSETTVQLTHNSTNLDPEVESNGWTVWEGWIPEEDGWQVFLFDTTSVRQLTGGDLAMNPDIEGENIIYGRRDITGQWKAVVYSSQEDKHVDVTVGEDAREPRLSGGSILLARGTEEFPLTLDDLLLLDLSALTEPISVPETVGIIDILNELEGLEKFIESSTSSANTNTEEATVAP